MRTAWTRPVIRTVLLRSFRSRRQVFRVAMACSPRARMGTRGVDRVLTCREPVPPAAAGHPHGAARARRPSPLGLGRRQPLTAHHSVG